MNQINLKKSAFYNSPQESSQDETFELKQQIFLKPSNQNEIKFLQVSSTLRGTWRSLQYQDYFQICLL